MSTKIIKAGILLTSPEDIIDGATNKNWSGSYSFSNGVFTCNAGGANLISVRIICCDIHY